MNTKSYPVITSHMLAQNSLSRVALSTPFATLADVVLAVRAADLPGRRRQELISALNTAARVLGSTLDQLPAEPLLFRKRLADAVPLACHVSPRRWNNVRSLTGAALTLAVPVTRSRNPTELTAEWQELRAGLSEIHADPRRYADLTRFMRFCSASGIAPATVDPAVFETFRISLLSSLRKHPEVTFTNCCSTWNKAADRVPAWPAFRVQRESRRKTWTLPWSDFPVSLSADVQVWLARLACLDVTVDLPFRPVRVSTLKTREYQLRAAASALVCQGEEPSAISGLADLVAFESFKKIVRHMVKRHNGSASGQVAATASLLRSIARHHVRLPADTLDAMAAIIRRMEPQQRGMTPVNRRRLRAYDEPTNVQALLGLPDRLVRQASRAGPSCASARLVQTALAIEILLMAPMRLANLAGLDTARHFMRIRNGKEVAITMEPGEVKNSMPLDFPLPEGSVALLELYLRDHRPLLALPGSTALFPGRKDGFKSFNMLREQISRTIRQYTGLEVNPHLFRHIAAKLFLDENPGAPEVIRRVLNHRSINTTTNFYTGMETAAAVRHFDRTILRLRDGGSLK